MIKNNIHKYIRNPTTKNFQHRTIVNFEETNSNIINIELNNKQTLDSKYLVSYFVGMLEGDGMMYTPSKEMILKKIRPCISFCFAIADLPHAQFFQNYFKMGSISFSKEKTYCKWTIFQTAHIVQLLKLINGHFRTPKIEAFSRIVHYYNEKYNLNLQVLPLNNDCFLNDAWFSGFSDSDSTFNLYYSKRLNKNYGITPKYCLKVAQYYKKKLMLSNEDFMNKLCSTFSVNLQIKESIHPKTGNKETSLTMSILREDNLSLLINYFNQYPLFSSKYLNYINFYNVINLKKQLKKEGKRLCDNIEKFEIYTNNHNSKRITYNWNHLNNFYSFPEDFPEYIKLDLRFKKKPINPN